MKISKAIWIAALALFAMWLLMDKSVEVIHGPKPDEVPAKREGLVRSLVRALAHWGLDRAFQTKPPAKPDDSDVQAVQLSTPTLSLHMPIERPSEFRTREGESIDHHAGW